MNNELGTVNVKVFPQCLIFSKVVASELVETEPPPGFRARIMARLGHAAPDRAPFGVVVWRTASVAAMLAVGAAVWLVVREPAVEPPSPEQTAPQLRAPTAGAPTGPDRVESARVEATPPDSGSTAATAAIPVRSVPRSEAGSEGAAVGEVVGGHPNAVVAGIEPLTIPSLEVPSGLEIEPIEMPAIQFADNTIPPLSIEPLVIEPLE